MTSRSRKTSQIAIFSRLIQADDGDLDARLAKYLLTLGFSRADQDRMSDLAVRNQQESLPADEKEELANYVRSGHLLALLHSKARKSLRRRRS